MGLIAPAAPSGLTATVTAGTNTVLLTWTDGADVESGFQIERGGNPFIVVGNVDANINTFTDTFPPARVPHEYRVLAFNRTASSAYSASTFVTPPLPATPSLVGIGPANNFNVTGNTLTLSGTGFADFLPGTNSVLFAGVPAAAVDVLDDATISAELPAGLTGPLDVLVTNLNGTALLTGMFTTYEWPAALMPSTTPLDTGATNGLSAGSIEMASVGANVYVVWSDTRDGMDRVYFNRSSDGGMTWQAMDVSLDSSTASASEPAISASGTSIYVAWQDTRDGMEDIYVNRSLDGGATWLMPAGTPDGIRIDTDTAGRRASILPRISSSGANVHVAWQDSRNSATGVFTNSSTSAGAIWLTADTRLDAIFADSGSVAISSSGDNVAVTWSENHSTGFDIQTSTSRDAGTTWQALSTQMDTDGIGADDSFNPAIASAGDKILVVWEDLRDSDSAIRANRSDDAGVTWQAADVRLDTGAMVEDSLHPRLARDGDDILVIWEDGRGTGEVRLNRSLDAGATWLTEDIAPAPSATLPSNLQVSVKDGSAFLAFEDNPSGARSHVFLSSSPDGGTTWQPFAGRLSDSNSGILSSTSARLLSAGARAIVVWENDRAGGRRLSFAHSVTEAPRSKEALTPRRPMF